MAVTVRELVNLIGWKVDKKQMSDAEKKTQKFMGRLKKVGLAVGAAIITIGTLAVRAAIDMETLTVQFEVMLGSAERAKEVVKDLTQFTAKTPFQLPDVALAARQLLAAGVAVEDMQDNLRVLGDLAAIANIPLGDMSGIFAKIKNKGKAMTEELLQMSDRGLPIIRALANEFGVTKEQIFKMAETGKISFDTIISSLRKMTAEGGIAFKGMEKLSLTAAGMISTMKDNITLFLAEVGRKLLPTITKVILKITDLFQNSLGRIIEGVLTTITPLLENVFSIVDTLMTATEPIIQALLDVLKPILEIVNILMPIVTDILEIFGGLASDLIRDFADIFIPLLEVMVELLNELMPILRPIIKIFAKLTALFIKMNTYGFFLFFKVISKGLTLMFKLLKPVVRLLKLVLVPAFELLEKIIKRITDFVTSVFNFVIEKIIEGVKFLITVLNNVIDIVNKIPFVKEKLKPLDPDEIVKNIKGDITTTNNKINNIQMKNQFNITGAGMDRSGIRDGVSQAVGSPFQIQIKKILADT